jgi:hypothetical protein
MEGVGGLKDMRVGEKGFVSEAEEQNKALVRRFLEAVQKGDSDTMHELLSPDFVDHSLLPGQEPGRDGYIEAVAEDHAAFQVGDELAAPMLRLIHVALSRRSTLHRYSHICKQDRLLLTKRCLFVNSVRQCLEIGFDSGVQAPVLAQLDHCHRPHLRDRRRFAGDRRTAHRPEGCCREVLACRNGVGCVQGPDRVAAPTS